MYDENSTIIGGAMDGMFLDRDCAINPVKRTDHLIVISWNVDNSRSFARFPQNLLDDVVMLLRPVTAATHLPDINQIADDVERLEIVLAQEIKEAGRAAGPRPEVDIRDPSGADASGRAAFKISPLEIETQ